MPPKSKRPKRNGGLTTEPGARTLPAFLPFELVALIGRFIHKRSTLLACASRCRMWRSALRPLMFRSVLITSQEHLTHLIQLIEGEASIGNWVNHIHLQNRPPKSHSPKALIQPAHTALEQMLTLLEQLSKALPNKVKALRSLEVSGGKHTLRWSPDVMKEIFQPFMTLRTLDVLKSSVSSTFLTSALMVLPQLTHLRMGALLHDSTKDPAIYVPHTRLEYLYIDDTRHFTFGESLHLFLIALSKSATAHTLQQLDVKIHSDQLWGAIAGFVSSPLSRLQILNIITMFSYPQAADLSVNLSHLKHLQRLHLEPLDHKGFVYTLNTIQDYELECISFGTSFDWLASVQPKAFDTLNSCLNQLRAKKVEICYSGPQRLERVSAKFAAVFPQLAARNVLQVVKVKDVDKIL